VNTLEQLLNELERMGDREVAETARNAIHAVLELHRDGLAKIIKHAAQAPDVQERLIRDPAVAALLLLHDLHPEPLATRVARAIDQARTGEPLELLHADAAVVRVRTTMSPAALESALLEHAPDAGPLHLERPPPGDLIPAKRLIRRETCDLCGAAIGDLHDHLRHGERDVLCVCSVCARTADDRGLEMFARPIAAALPDELWLRLGIPVEFAFIVERATGEHIAMYPGPAGLVEATVDTATWRELSPESSAIKPEGEALLCDRLSDPPRHYHASIAACYAVAGLFRRHWRDGRREAWSHVRRFLAGLAEAA